MEMSVKEYLDSVANPNTRKGYRIGIQKFCEWSGKTPSEILEMNGKGVEYCQKKHRFTPDLVKPMNYLKDGNEVSVEVISGERIKAYILRKI